MKIFKGLKKGISYLIISTLITGICIPLTAFGQDGKTVEKNGEIYELTNEELEAINKNKKDLEKLKKDKIKNPENYESTREKFTEDDISTYAFDVVYEQESNDSYSLADRVYENERMHATIEDEDDEDYFKIKYSDYGIAEILLYSIPSGCDYDLFVYNSDKDEIRCSLNGGDDDDLVYFQAEPGEWYYIRIASSYGWDDEDEYRVRFYEIQPYRANLYAADQGGGSINTLEDNEVGEEYFGNSLNYDINRFDDPRKSDFWEIDGAAIVTVSGHGTADTIKLKDSNNSTASKCGLKNGRSETVGNYKYVGIKDVDFGACTLAVLPSCLTASESTEYSRNIAENIVKLRKATASIGWSELIYNRDMPKYLDSLYRLLSEGYTIQDAKNTVATIFGDQWDSSVYSSVIYGDGDATLILPTITTRSVNKNNIEYIKIDEEININKNTKYFDELTNYLEENVDIFNTENFVLDESKIFNNNDENYAIFYNYVIDGFTTPYYLIVLCKDGLPDKYYLKMPDDTISLYNLGNTINAASIPESIIDEAKTKAIENIPEDTDIDDFSIIDQNVTARISEDGKRFLRIQTKFEYEIEGEIFGASHRYEFLLSF